MKLLSKTLFPARNRNVYDNPSRIIKWNLKADD